MPSTACPTCKRDVPFPADHEPMGTFPFCSERCKLIDLGRWFDGKYQIPVEADDDEQAEAPPEADGPPPPPELPPHRRGPRW